MSKHRRRLAFQLALLTGTLTYWNSGFAQAHADILAMATESQPPAFALLERLVNIDTGTGNVAGVNQVGAIVGGELEKLGGHVEMVPSTTGVGNNVLATFMGTGQRKILLIAHMDTVFADGSAQARPFRNRDGRVYGPGAMDDKGGVVMALYTLTLLKRLHFTDYARITLLLNCNEETGSVGSRALIEAQARLHDVALNFEPGRPADGLVVWRKGSAVALVEVTGKAAHAGVAPESGRNAAMEVAHQILQLSALGDPAKLTTINFTVLKAGDRSNVIPDSATAQGDVRVAVPEEFDRIEADLTRMAQHKLIADTVVKVTLLRDFPPMPKNPQSDALADQAQAIYGELGMRLTLEGSGGAADSSLSAGMGTPTLDGFGIVGGNIHTPEEYGEVASFIPRLYLATRLLMELGHAQ